MAINQGRPIFPARFLGVAMAAPGMIHPVDVVKSRIQALPTSCSHQECCLTGDFGMRRLVVCRVSKIGHACRCIARGRLILKAVDELQNSHIFPLDLYLRNGK